MRPAAGDAIAASGKNVHVAAADGSTQAIILVLFYFIYMQYYL